MAYDAWGNSWGATGTNGEDGNGAWGVAWLFTTARVTGDTHDGADHDRRRKVEDEAKRDARTRLREQIRTALEGPDAAVARAALTPYSKKSDAKPFIETLDIERVEKRVPRALARIFERIDGREAERQAYEAAIEQDDEDVFRLL